jgi:hypothetical protein
MSRDFFFKFCPKSGTTFQLGSHQKNPELPTGLDSKGFPIAKGKLKSNCSKFWLILTFLWNFTGKFYSDWAFSPWFF